MAEFIRDKLGKIFYSIFLCDENRKEKKRI